MLPMVLDLSRLATILIGDGEAALRRLNLLEEAGAVQLTIFAEAPSEALARAAGKRLVRRLPQAEEIAAARLVFLSDRKAAHTPDIVTCARQAGAFVHVEDEPSLSDMHSTAILRQGKLTIAISTGGASPGLAVQLKRFLGTVFGPEWRERLEQIGTLRHHWRAEGADYKTLAKRSDEWISQQGWLPPEEALPWSTGKAEFQLNSTAELPSGDIDRRS